MMLPLECASRPFWLLGLAVGLTVPFLCACSCEEDRPYTPFSVATSVPSPRIAPLASGAPGLPFGPQVEVAPPLSKTWKVFETTLTAPPEGTFLAAATVGTDNAARSVVAWVDGDVPVAGLWLFSATGVPARRMVASPAFLPRAPDCKPRVQLQPSGKSTVGVDLTHQCTARQLPGAAERALLVVNLQSPQPLVHGLRVAPLSNGENLGLSVSGSDLDADGADDISVELKLTSPAGASESMTIHWLLRPAGSSRQKDTPSEEFGRKARNLVTAAQRKAERSSVPAVVDVTRRLFSAVCSESGAARVTQWDASPLVCGAIEPSLPYLTAAAIHAHLGLKQPGRALGEFERATWYGPALREQERAALEKAILARASKGAPRSRGTVTSPLGPRQPGVFSRRINFGGDRLFAQTADGVPRAVWPVADPSSTEEMAEGNLKPWSLSGEGADGRRVTAVLPSCDQSEVQVAFSTASGGAAPSLALPVLAPRPGQCKKWGGGPLTAELLGWSADEPVIAVGGEVFRPSGQRQLPTGISTSLGFAVETEGKLQLWRDPYFTADLECTAHANYELVACVKGDTITVWQPPDAFE